MIATAPVTARTKTMRRLMLGVVVVGFCCVTGCKQGSPGAPASPSAAPRVPGTTAASAQPAIPWTEVSGGSADAAGRALDPVVQRYAHCRSYRDRGVVTSTVLRSGGKRSVTVSRFDTLFVRDVGLRFRFYDEQGRPHAALWQHGAETTIWHLGKATRARSAADALVILRGVTSLASDLVPALLLEAPLFYGEHAFLSGARGLAGTASGGCGKCWLVAFGSGKAPPQFLLTVDENAAVLRRFQAVMVVRTPREDAEADGAFFGSDLLISYEPEFDLADSAALVRDLELQPW